MARWKTASDQAESLVRRVTRTDDPLVDLLDDASAESALQRREARTFEQLQDLESATFLGTLIDCGEASEQVTVHLQTGDQFAGSIVRVGSDVVTLEEANGTLSIRSTEIAMIERPSSRREARGDRVPLAFTFAEVIRNAAAERLDVAIGARGCREPIAGRMWSAGTDVCTVQVPVSRRLLHMQLDAVVFLREMR